MSKKRKYYSEQTLVEMFQSGKISWLGYVKHHSPEWSKEYVKFCEDNNLQQDDQTAHKFLDMKDKQLEEGQ